METKPKLNRANKRVICLKGNTGKYFYAAYDSTKKFGWFVSDDPAMIERFFKFDWFVSQPLPYYVSRRLPNFMKSHNFHKQS